MADTADNGRDSSSMRSAGAGSTGATRPATLTASSSSNISNYASSVSSDNQSLNQSHNNLSGSTGAPGTPVSRRSGGWDRQTLSPAAAARVRLDDVSIDYMIWCDMFETDHYARMKIMRLTNRVIYGLAVNYWKTLRILQTNMYRLISHWRREKSLLSFNMRFY